MIKKEERSSFSLFYPRGCLLRGSVAEEGERERGKGRKRDRDLVGGGWLKHGRADMKGIQVRADGSRRGDSYGDDMFACVFMNVNK